MIRHETIVGLVDDEMVVRGYDLVLRRCQFVYPAASQTLVENPAVGTVNERIPLHEIGILEGFEGRISRPR